MRTSTSFIVLIERQTRRIALGGLLLLAAMLVTPSVRAAEINPKIATDLWLATTQLVAAPSSWLTKPGAEPMAEVLVVGNSTDPELKSLSSAIRKAGGTVLNRYTTVRALLASVPSSALTSLAQRNDVLSISPNRPTQRMASTLEATTGTLTSAVRPPIGLPGSMPLDGSGVGIAILDSGVMSAHQHFLNAAGQTRVAMNLDFVGYTGASFMATQPNTSARAKLQAQVTRTGASMPDVYGHGSHVAAVAAGRAMAGALTDTAGIAPGATIFDLRVLADDGTGRASDTLAAIDWVVANAKAYNIRVMNLSLASGSTESWQTDPLARAARAATAAGVVVVAAGGNFG